jgi:sulfur carrier protein ThiS adenylyltransferase
MANLDFLVAGVGAVGKQVAIQLAAAGAENITMYDHDTIEEGNLASQGWLEQDIGKHKVNVVKDMISSMNSQAKVTARPCMINQQVWNAEKRNIKTPDVVLSCIDSIKGRQELFETFKDVCILFVDGRMGAESCRIIAVSQNKEYYPTTLFSQEEAYAAPCTARSTIYCANIEAGFMVAMVTRWMRTLKTHKTCDFVLNIPAYALDTFA